jgi:phage-related protein
VTVATKPVVWEASSKEDVSGFPEDIREDAGYALWLIQQGEDPPNTRPLALVGSGVREIRLSDGDAYRVLYVAKFTEAVYVLHAFQKKAKAGIATPKPDVDLASSRYKLLIQRRKLEGQNG